MKITKLGTALKTLTLLSGVCLLIIGLVSSLYVYNAAAHQGTPVIEHDPTLKVIANDVTTNDPASVKAFVRHAAAHIEKLTNEEKQIAFLNQVTADNTDWRSGELYLILIDPKTKTVFIHGYYDNTAAGAVLDERLKTQAEKDTLYALINVAGGEDATGGEGGSVGSAYALAYRTSDPTPDIKRKVRNTVLIGGFHHGELTSPKDLPSLGTTASDVEDAETLKDFVGAIIEYITGEIQAGNRLAAHYQIRSLSRLEPGPFRAGPIYMFGLYDEENDFAVVVNGLDASYENSKGFKAIDDNDCNIGEEISRATKGEPLECKDLGLLKNLPEDIPEGGAFIQYLWDNPDIKSDDVRHPDTGLPIEGRSPGTSPKLSYIQELRVTGSPFIFGSGIYPAGNDDDRGACVIAGAGNTLRSTVLNLFLIIITMVLGILLKRSQNQMKFPIS